MASEPQSERPTRVPKPSQKARAAAAVTKTAAKKAKKRTLKEATKTSKKRRRVVPAAVPAVSEVIDLADDEATQAPSAPQNDGTDEDLLRSNADDDEDAVVSQDFEYTALWRVDDKKERLDETVRDYVSTLWTTPLSEFKAWYEGLLLDDLRDYRLKKVSIAAGHEKRIESRWMAAGGTQSDFSRLLKRLVDSHSRGIPDLQMSFTAHLEKTPAALALAASQSTQSRRSQGSTTQRMLARLPDVRSELESEGNMASKITEEWICKQGECKRYGQLCWWGVKDTKEYHMAIQGVHLAAWCAAIERGERDEKDLGPSLIQQMTRHHARSLVGAAKAPASMVPPTPAGTHFSFAFNGAGSNSSAIEQSAIRPVASSPIQMPTTQSSAIELREEFLRWCYNESSWASEHARLDAMQLKFDAAGFDLEGIAKCTAETWREAELPVAYRRRMKTTAKRWLFDRADAARRSRSSSNEDGIE